MHKFIALCIVLLIAAPLHAAPACRGKTPINYVPLAQRYTSGLLFKVGKCGEAPSFIFGTVHSDDPQVTQAAAAAFAILPRAQGAGFEYVEPEDAQEIARRAMMFDPAGKQTLPQLIGKKSFAQLAPKLQALTGMEPETTAHLKPWAAAVLLQYPPDVADGVVLDMKLQYEAKARHIPVYGLETLEEQFQIFDTLPQLQQIEMLKESLQDDTIDAQNQKLITAYLAEDLRSIQKIPDASFARIKDRKLAAVIEDRVLHQRNHTMVKQMRTPLKQGHQLIAVGALHLLGKDGILTLLERKGYLVQPLSSHAPHSP